MIRAVLEEALVFLAPFAAFALLLVLRRKRVLDPESWSGRTLWLAIAGLVLIFASFMGEGIFTDRPAGGFEPTHVENGRVVPGRFR